MEKLVVGEYYPVAPNERLPKGYDRRTTRVLATGEKRPPKKGEWFLSGSRIEGYPALCDMTTTYHIGKLVRGAMETVWRPTD